jgi:two-component system NtrC family sensor kinase
MPGSTRRELHAQLPAYEELSALSPVAGDATGRNVQSSEFRFGTPPRIISETVFALPASSNTQRRSRPLIRGDDRRRVVRIMSDITEQRRLEEQLIQSEKLAALGELISGVAHELNNPLTTVTGYAQLLQDDPSIPLAARRQIEHIYEDASRAARIVSNLLSFVRREDTRRDFIDVNEALRALGQMLSYQMQTENVRLAFEYSNDLPQVVGDSHQLQQVFLNVINNAQQALHAWRGGGTISLETKSVPVSGAPGILISIRDNGPGIAPEHLRRLFDPFWTTKQAGEGTGLGMSISLGIISRHGGRIWAESTLGHGAQFFIELPGAPEGERPPSEPTAEASSTRFAAQEATPQDQEKVSRQVDDEMETGAQILVVDDEEPVIFLMSEILGLDDHEITAAFNGGEALALLQERDFDLIISDVRMPAIGGPTFFEILQTTRPDLLPRVVFVTGDTMSRSTQEFLQRAGRPMLAKPFGPDRLRALVREQLEKNR